MPDPITVAVYIIKHVGAANMKEFMALKKEHPAAHASLREDAAREMAALGIPVREG